MKTQIIQLDPKEDIVSVHDKMSWSQAGRILLVWPKVGYVLDRKLDLILVAHRASSLSAQLALVTSDKQVQFFASRLGIPLYPSILQAQQAEWPKVPRIEFKRSENAQHDRLLEQGRTIQGKSSTWQEKPSIKVACLVTSLLALFALGIFILPGAEIHLTPRTEAQMMVFDIVADPTTNSINYSTGSLPTYPLEVVVEKNGSMAASGSVTIPARAATGDLHFTNNSDYPQIIPAGTIVTTAGDHPIRFITTAAEAVSVEAWGHIDLPARAFLPGTTSNLEDYTLTIIEGKAAEELTVYNPDAMTGGKDASVPSPTEGDLVHLHQQLTSELLEDARRQLQSILPDGDIMLPATISVIETMDETSFPAVGAPGNTLQLSIQQKVQVQTVSMASLQALIIPIMNSYTPAGFSPQTSPLEITPIRDQSSGRDGRVYWTVRVTRQLQAAIIPDQVVKQAAGRRASQAGQRLYASLPLASQPDIHLSPAWWPWLPFVAMRIQLVQAGVQ